MREFLRRVVRFLRSPKLALWTVLALAAYLVIGTAVPQVSQGPAKVMAWTAAHPVLSALARPLGLFEAFLSPMFFALVALLTVSTATCAWARTARARSIAASEAKVTDALVDALSSRPAAVIAVHDSEDALALAADALRAVGLKSRVGPRLLVASSGRWGLLGSPVFHWALVALFVVVALGQLTRAEGMIGIPVGGARIESAESYGTLESGRLFSGHTGLTISVPRLQGKIIEGDLDRGTSPVVALSRDGEMLKQQLVYPNKPLRWGSLLIHRSQIGFSIPVSVESSTGEQAFRSDQLIDLDGAAAAGSIPSRLTLDGLPGGSLDLTLTLVAVRYSKDVIRMSPSKEMSVGVEVSRGSAPLTMTVPGTYALADGLTLSLGPVVNYARIVVVNDWSVYWIYALLVLGMLGLSVAILVPYRTVWVLLVFAPHGDELHIQSRHSRRDPVFASIVEDSLRNACAPAEEDVT